MAEATERAELVAIQVALARGYIQQQDLREAVSIHQRRQLEGNRCGLLSVLGDSYLRPEHLPELRAIYEQALRAAGSDRLTRTRADESDRGVIHDAPTRGGRAPSSSGSHVALVDRIGRYELLDELGRGGMGVVHRARDPELGRDVALKVLAPDASSQEERERFHREARAAASLRHPNIVRVLDVGIQHDPPFLVMDLVEGESLKSKVGREGALDPRLAAELTRKLALALGAAHRIGLIHRDVKPANVLLDAAGEPFLTDFGLARRLDEKRLTQSGDVVGTPHYMSPEQARGDKDIDPRTDVWSLGAVLYHLLVGRPPLKEVSLVEHMKALLNKDAQAPSVERPGLPPELDAAVLRCLSRERERRYATMAELIQDLDRFLAPPPPPPRPGLGAAPLVAAGLLGTALVSVLGIVLLGGGAPVPSTSTTVRPPSPPPPTVPPGPSPDQDRAQELRRQAERYAQQGQLEKAFAALEESLVLDPRRADALALRAELHAAAGRQQEALIDLGTAIELDPLYSPYRLRRAAVNLALGRRAQAIEDLEVAWKEAQRGPRAAEVRADLVQALLQGGVEAMDRSDARTTRSYAERALELEPERGLAWGLLAQALNQQEDFAGARQAADRALADRERLRREGALGFAVWARAQALTRLGQRQEGLADFDQALEELSGTQYEGLIRLQRAMSRGNLHDYGGAEADAERALELLPAGHPYRGRAEQVLKQLRGASSGG